MSTTQHTGHYNLPTFGDNPNDRPSWRGDFTDAMTKIDNQMYANATNITTATAAANNATAAANNATAAAGAAKQLAQTNKTDIAEQESCFNALGVTSTQTAQALKSSIDGKAENTALTALRGTVSSLSGTVAGKADTTSVYTKAQADTTFVKQGGYPGTAKTLDGRISANASQISTTNSALEALRNNGVNPIDVYQFTDSVYGTTVDYHAYYSPIAKLVLLRVTITGSATNWSKGLNAAEKPVPPQYRPAGGLRQVLAVFVGEGNTMPAHILYGINSEGYPYVDQEGPRPITQANLGMSAMLSYFTSL